MDSSDAVLHPVLHFQVQAVVRRLLPVVVAHHFLQVPVLLAPVVRHHSQVPQAVQVLHPPVPLHQAVVVFLRLRVQVLQVAQVVVHLRLLVLAVVVLPVLLVHRLRPHLQVRHPAQVQAHHRLAVLYRAVRHPRQGH